ncbi:MAG: hypothetical protein GWP10_11230 [Nitrospiraceae bacterium]|nr:hypothetical protein [Nitrospiraceae bacterium]
MGCYDEFDISNYNMILLTRKVIIMQEDPLRFVQLLTMWCERPARPGQPVLWRFSVEDIHTGERRGFADLEALTAFLQAQMADTDPVPPDNPSHS